MKATIGCDAPHGRDWVYEPKYDGVRVLAIAIPGADGPRVELRTRNGNDKAPQFPDVAAAVAALAADLDAPLVLDGEIVALTAKGEPARFNALQSRIHIGGRGADLTIAQKRAAAKAALAAGSPRAALVAFDVLADGGAPGAGRRGTLAPWAPLAGEPWTARRARLEALLARCPAKGALRLSTYGPKLDTMLRRAQRRGWEGLIAKRTDALYALGTRTPAWCKLKLELEQEFVVGGWTDPKRGRPALGALLLGVYDEAGALRYAGAVGTGFGHAMLHELRARLDRIGRRTSPFADAPTMHDAHWVRPSMVVQVRFTEWTRDGRLRHPAFIGLRDDKPARDVIREPDARVAVAMAASGERRPGSGR